MEKIEAIRVSLIESYTKSFRRKEPIASLFSDIEILMLTIDEDPEVFLSQYDEREIQMYNYLLNEMITELRKRSTERQNAERIELVGIRNPRPITVHQVNRNEWNARAILPKFEIPKNMKWPELEPLSIGPAVMDQRNITPDFNLRATDRRQTTPDGNIAPTIPHRSEIVMDASLDTELQNQNFHQPVLMNVDEQNVSPTSEIRNIVETQPILLPNETPVEPRDLIGDVELQTSDAMRSNIMPTTSEIQQFGSLVDIEEDLVQLPDLAPSLRRIKLPSTNELSTRQQIQSNELEVNIPEIPPEDPFLQEFKVLFERRRSEKAAIDYAARATHRAKRSSLNLKYRDLTRGITILKPVSDEGQTFRITPIFSRVCFSDISNIIQNLMISTSNQNHYQSRHQRSSTDRTLHTEFSNLIVHKPQSTPETPYSGKQKPKKWTSALPVLEEDQMDVQRVPNGLEDQNQVLINSKSTESHQTPLTAKPIQREITGWKLTGSKSPLPVLRDEIEPPPAGSTSIQERIIEQTSEIMEDVINAQSKIAYSETVTTNNERLKQQRAKRLKLTTEKVYPTTQKPYPTTEERHLTEDTVFKKYLKSWKQSFLLNANDAHCDVHFPVDLLRMLDFGTPVQQVLKEIVDNGDNQLSNFLPTTTTRKEASKRIQILLELRTQNVLDFVVQDGEVKGITLKC